MYQGLDVEQTRLIVDYEHQLALLLLQAKACPPTWARYCLPVTCVRDHVNVVPGDNDPQVEEGPSLLQYPERMPTTQDRNDAYVAMTTLFHTFMEEHSLCPALLISISSAYVAFLRDARLSFLLTRRYGLPQLGVFSHVPLPGLRPEGLDLDLVSINLAFTTPPPNIIDGDSWRSRRMEENGFGVESVQDSMTGGGLALLVGPARFVNHSCRRANLIQPRPVNPEGTIHAPYADWYQTFNFSPVSRAGSVPARNELLWNYRPDFFGDDCKCEGHVPVDIPPIRKPPITKKRTAKTRLGLRSDSRATASESSTPILVQSSRSRT